MDSAKDLLKKLGGLFEEYSKEEYLTCHDYLEEKINQVIIPEETARMFLVLWKHKDYLKALKDLTNKFLISNGVIPSYAAFKSNHLDIFIFLIVFHINAENVDTLNSLISKDLKIFPDVVRYFMQEEFLLELVEVSCKFYENAYIVENILGNILTNKSVFESFFQETTAKILKKKANSLTKFCSEKHYMKPKSILPPPPELPKVQKFVSNPVPKTTYKAEDFESKIEESKAINRRKALHLLKEARENAFKCAREKPKTPLPKPQEAKFKITIKKPNFSSNVTIKNTTTTLMRQAALLSKEKEEELKKIDELLTSIDYNTNLEEEIRQAKEQETLQDIERKHLLGLLTREEAILAKQKSIAANQERKQNYQEERVKLIETLDKFKQQEEERIKKLVEKTQMIEKGVKEAEKKLLQEKRCNAKLVDFETQTLLKKAYRERQEELYKKIQIIKELKTLQRINTSNASICEFDRTETANLGLLCEMSIVELQARLTLVKRQMKDKLDERRAKITLEKKKQQQLLENMKQFITKAKKYKSKPSVGKISRKNEDTPEDIKELRQKLQNARNARQNLLSTS